MTFMPPYVITPDKANWCLLQISDVFASLDTPGIQQQ